VFDVLELTIRRVHGLEARCDQSTAHVSGRQMCHDLRTLANDRWGPLAPIVLQAWGVHSTLDFGRVVHAMIDAGILAGSETDRLSDFDRVFDFGDVWPVGASACQRGGRSAQHA
jgi:uncharacterized repeat protein (TIGR04138 family)